MYYTDNFDFFWVVSEQTIKDFQHVIRILNSILKDKVDDLEAYTHPELCAYCSEGKPNPDYTTFFIDTITDEKNRAFTIAFFHFCSEQCKNTYLDKYIKQALNEQQHTEK